MTSQAPSDVLGPASSAPRAGETSDAITRDFRILQRKSGHRYSVDDVATAWAAATAWTERYGSGNESAGPPHAVDLGTGIGSVLLMLAWKFPQARLSAVEAQAVSFELLQRNVLANDLTGRVTTHHGDLRKDLPFGKAQLVTGTPPYLPPGTATAALDEQRMYARIELRGGVEAYCEAASRVLAPGGLFVLCADARTWERTEAAGAAVGLVARSRRDIVPRAGKGALFTLHVFERPQEGAASQTEKPPIEVAAPLVIRDEAGDTTEAARVIRATFGL